MMAHSGLSRVILGPNTIPILWFALLFSWDFDLRITSTQDGENYEDDD